VRDFTLSMYGQFLEAITNTEYTAISVHDYLKSAPDRCVILRHDVDRAVKRSLDMAQLEHEYGIRSTYYFRHTDEVFKPDYMHAIADLGHEIGFHYEVLDKAKGDLKKAINIFEKELNELRDVEEITTVCMHGNPLSQWLNRDIWKKYDFKEFGILGEPYLSIDYNKVLYLTDTGRTWADLKIRVKDVLNSGGSGANSGFVGKIASTKDLIEFVKSEEVPQMCILAHPNRWCDDTFGWTKEIISQNIKNIGKAGLVWYRNRRSL